MRSILSQCIPLAVCPKRKEMGLGQTGHVGWWFYTSMVTSTIYTATAFVHVRPDLKNLEIEIHMHNTYELYMFIGIYIYIL